MLVFTFYVWRFLCCRNLLLSCFILKVCCLCYCVTGHFLSLFHVGHAPVLSGVTLFIFSQLLSSFSVVWFSLPPPACLWCFCFSFLLWHLLMLSSADLLLVTFGISLPSWTDYLVLTLAALKPTGSSCFRKVLLRRPCPRLAPEPSIPVFLKQAWTQNAIFTGKPTTYLEVRRRPTEISV